MSSLSSVIIGWFAEKLAVPVLLELKQMEVRIMAQVDDLKAGEDQIDADVKALVDQDTKSFADLEAAVAAGKTGTDLTPFINQLKNTHTALAAALVSSQTADATLTPPVTPAP